MSTSSGDAAGDNEPTPSAEVFVSRKGLFKTGTEHPRASPEAMAKKTPLTPVCQDILSLIDSRGPMTVAQYMQLCLTSPKGYYCNEEVFGREGDFVTSPEISQMFGEMIAVWVIHTWKQMGSPARFHYIELGPGKGRLLQDFLRVADQFDEFKAAVSVHLVEASPLMIQEQMKAADLQDRPEMTAPELKGVSKTGIKVQWHNDYSDVPRTAPFVVVGNEFFDALPIHQFQFTERGWMERLIDADTTPDGPHHLRFVLSNDRTPAASTFLYHDSPVKLAPPKLTPKLPESVRAALGKDKQALGRGLLKRTDTGAEVLLDDMYTKPSPMSLQETDDLKSFQSAVSWRGRDVPLEHLPSVGDRIEVGAASMSVVDYIAKDIERFGNGAALFIDYGADHAHQETLQGIRRHSPAHILEEPGAVDLSAHVDFSALARVARRASPKIKVFPLLPQGHWLLTLGMFVRFQRLCENLPLDRQEVLFNAVQRLCHPHQMGMHFRVFCFAHQRVGAPGGFEAESIKGAESYHIIREEEEDRESDSELD